MLTSTLCELYLSVNLLFCKVVIPLRLYLRAVFDRLTADWFNHIASSVDENADKFASQEIGHSQAFALDRERRLPL
jgi:hypothetical protein